MGRRRTRRRRFAARSWRSAALALLALVTAALLCAGTALTGTDAASGGSLVEAVPPSGAPGVGVSGVGAPVITTPSSPPPAAGASPRSQYAAWALDERADVAVVYRVGDVIRYSFVVTNTGTATLTNLRVDSARLRSVILGVSCPATALAPGAHVTCAATGPYAVSEQDVLAGSVVDTATVTADVPPGASRPTPPTDTVAVPVARPALGLVTTVATVNGTPLADGQQLRLGDEVVWGFRVTNTGNVAMNRVVVHDGRLAGAGVQVACPVAPLAGGATTDCRSAPYTVTQADVDAGSVSNAATVEGAPPATAQSPSPPTTVTPPSGTETPTEQVAAITLDKRAQRAGVEDGAPLVVGQKVAYSFTVKNTGTVTLSTVTIDDARLGLAGFVCSGTPLAPQDEVTCAAPAPYTVTAADVAAGTVGGTATATGQPPAGIASPVATVRVGVRRG